MRESDRALDRTRNRPRDGSGRSDESSSTSRDRHRASPAHRARSPNTSAGSDMATAVRRRCAGTLARRAAGRAPAGRASKSSTPPTCSCFSASDGAAADTTRDVGDRRRDNRPRAGFAGGCDAHEDIPRRQRRGVRREGSAQASTNGVALHRVADRCGNGVGDAHVGPGSSSSRRRPGHVEGTGSGAHSRPLQGAKPARAMYAANPARAPWLPRGGVGASARQCPAPPKYGCRIRPTTWSGPWPDGP